ncbi:MAG: type VI secretion system tube protein Hcp [Planctomycetota bacterium]
MIGYLKLGDIKGNSQDANHKEWIEVMTISQSVNRNINPTSKPRDALSKSQVHVGAIEFQKNADESSPELVAAVCEGRVFPEVTIDLVRVSGSGNEVFYQWVLTDAYIIDYGVHGQSLGSIDTTENLAIAYSEIKWSFKKKDEKGKPQGSVDTGWNLSQNRKG